MVRVYEYRTKGGQPSRSPVGKRFVTEKQALDYYLMHHPLRDLNVKHSIVKSGEYFEIKRDK